MLQTPFEISPSGLFLTQLAFLGVVVGVVVGGVVGVVAVGIVVGKLD